MSYSHKYYVSHKEKYLAAQKRYIEKKRKEADPEWLSERSEYMKNYYKNNPDKREMKREYDRKYREEHRDYFRKKAKEYKEKKKLEKENE